MLKILKSGELTGHSGAVYCLAQGRQAHTVFSGASDGFIAEWNLETLQAEKFSIKLNSPVFSICHIPEINLLVAGLFNGHLYLIDLKNRTEIKNFDLKNGGVFSIHFAQKLNRFFTTGADGVFMSWNIKTFQPEITLPLSLEKIRQVYFHPEQDLISVCSGSGELILLEPEFYNEIGRLSLHQGGVNSCMLYNGNIYSVGKDALLKITEISTLKTLSVIPAHNYGIYRIIGIDERFFMTCSRDKTIKVWDSNALEAPLRLDFKNFKGHTQSVNDLLLCKWNNSIISCSDDKRIIVWKINQ